MEQTKNIRYVTDKFINKQKWDVCINNSVNGLVYAYSWYLDSCVEKWAALILENYEAVMPIPLVKKRGRWRIQSSRLFTQLGVFSRIRPSQDTILLFFNELSKYYKRWELPFNVMNPSYIEGYKGTEKQIYSKDLIYSSTVLKRMVKPISSNEKIDGLSVVSDTQLSIILNFVLKTQGNKVRISEILGLRRIISFSSHFGFGKAYSVYYFAYNLIGLSYLLRFQKRLYLLFFICDETVDKNKIFQKILNRVYSDFEKKDFVLECNTHGDKELQKLLLENGFSVSSYMSFQKKFNALKWLR